MQLEDEVEDLLSATWPRQLSEEEVASALKVSKKEAREVLAKLVTDGRISKKRGKYGAGEGSAAKKWAVRGSELDVLAQKVGLRPELLRAWLDEKKAKDSEEESMKILRRLLSGNLEGKAPKTPRVDERSDSNS